MSYFVDTDRLSLLKRDKHTKNALTHKQREMRYLERVRKVRGKEGDTKINNGGCFHGKG